MLLTVMFSKGTAYMQIPVKSVSGLGRHDTGTGQGPPPVTASLNGRHQRTWAGAKADIHRFKLDPGPDNRVSESHGVTVELKTRVRRTRRPGRRRPRAGHWHDLEWAQLPRLGLADQTARASCTQLERSNRTIFRLTTRLGLGSGLASAWPA
jgi:hypothetical protein